MEATIVFTKTAEESRALKAFIQAMNLAFRPAKPSLAELEVRLTTQQNETWQGLKKAIIEVETGTAVGTTWEDFLKELDDEDSITQRVQTELQTAS